MARDLVTVKEVVNDFLYLLLEDLGNLRLIEDLHVDQSGAELTAALLVQSDRLLKISFGDPPPVDQHVAQQGFLRVDRCSVNDIAVLEGHFLGSGRCRNPEDTGLLAGGQQLQDIREGYGFEISRQTNPWSFIRS